MRPMFPRSFKSFLVFFWNSAHRFGWFIYDLLNAIGHGRFERCTVCGRFRPMLYRRRIIPRRLEELWGISPRQAEAFAQGVESLRTLRSQSPMSPDRPGCAEPLSGW